MLKECPHCKESRLEKIMTKQGALIDYCTRCKGIWLDKGQIYLFAKDSRLIKQEIENGLQKMQLSRYTSPISNKAMIKISILNNTAVLNYCPETQGIWIDFAELDKLNSADQKVLLITFDKKSYNYVNVQAYKRKEKKDTQSFLRHTALLPLPNIMMRSVTVLIGLYGLLTIVLITLVEFAGLSLSAAILIGIAIASFQFLLSPYIMDFSLKWFYKMDWVSASELPLNLNDFIETVSSKNNMKYPRIGLIHDGSPNAFTYGHHPNNARIVFTQGILDLLNEDETEAVVAHEIGHAKHWDMLIMTVAQLVPLILYYVYRTLISLRVESDDNDNSGAYRTAIAIGAYILYIFSQYLVLWLSRTREYYADRFAGYATGNPNLLASALVKIGYGLAGEEPKKDKEKGKITQRNARLEAIGALGIFDRHTAKSLAVASYSAPGTMGGKIDKNNLKEAMKWDIWNPWAKYYEIHSTHPLIANRLCYLSNQAYNKGLEPFIIFDEVKPESYWDEFLVDLLLKFSPLLVLIIFGVMYLLKPISLFLGSGLFMLGLSLLVLTNFSYKHDYFPEMNIVNLLKKVKVSSVRPVPCTLKGKVIGRGVPGLIWSEDFVLQDDTGIIFLDYKQPLRIWEFLFAIFRRESLKNKEVTITGWYRRAPVPYIELKNLSMPDKIRTCYVYHFKLAFAILLTIIGIFALLGTIL